MCRRLVVFLCPCLRFLKIITYCMYSSKMPLLPLEHQCVFRTFRRREIKGTDECNVHSCNGKHQENGRDGGRRETQTTGLTRATGWSDTKREIRHKGARETSVLDARQVGRGGSVERCVAEGGMRRSSLRTLADTGELNDHRNNRVQGRPTREKTTKDRVT